MDKEQEKEKIAYYEAANKMYVLEHTRWNHHALLFLGIISSALIGSKYIENVVSSWFIFTFLTLLSFFWFCSILSNRRSSFSWFKTLRLIEDTKDDKKSRGTFNIFHSFYQKFSYCKDLASNFMIVPQNGGKKRKFLAFTSVTRIYTILSITLMFTFATLAVMSYYNSYSETKLGKLLIKRDIKEYNSEADLISITSPDDNNHYFYAEIAFKNGIHKKIVWEVNDSGKIKEPTDFK